MITCSSPKPSDDRREHKWWRERITRVAEWLEKMHLDGSLADAHFDTSSGMQVGWHDASDVKLLERRMIALDLDPDELGQTEAALIRHLQQRCMSCASPRRCWHDLEREAAGRIGADRLMWLEYCPNAQTLEMLSVLRGCTEAPPKYSFPYLA